MKAREIVIGLCLEHNGNWEKVFKDINDKKTNEMTTTDNVITLLDQEYPENLKQGYKPPFALFYQGNIKLLKDENYNKLGIVGEQLVENLDLVLSKDLDNICFVLNADSSTAIEIAMAYPNPIIMVCANAIEECLTQNQIETIVNKGGLILTERPIIYQNVDKDEIAFSSRIVADLSESMLVLNVNKRSLATITINFALRNGDKKIMVLPTDIVKGKNLANNELIYSGAIPVYDQDVFKQELVSQY